MDSQRNTIVEEFFKKGKLVTPQALDMLAADHKYNPDRSTQTDASQRRTSYVHYTGVKLSDASVDTTTDLIVDSKHINSLSIKLFRTKETVTTEDFIVHFNKKYEKMKAIIESRVPKNYTSINKLSGSKREICTIGIVRNIDNEKIEIEDLTGTTTINIQNSDIELDDVIAVEGIDGGGSVYNAKILFPDTPLRTPVKGKGRVCFISGLNIQEVPPKHIESFFQWISEQNVQFLFIIGSTKDVSKTEHYIRTYCHGKSIIIMPSEKYPQNPEKFSLENIISVSNPAIIEINNVKILVVSEFKITNLRKRQLKQPKTPTEPFVLEEVPDIVAYSFPPQPQVSNYKATTIVNAGSFLTSPRPVIIDFETREAEQINLKLE